MIYSDLLSDQLRGKDFYLNNVRASSICKSFNQKMFTKLKIDQLEKNNNYLAKFADLLARIL